VIVIDARKTNGNNPSNWTYGVCVKVDNKKQELTFRFERSLRSWEKPPELWKAWIAAVAAVAAKALQITGLESYSGIKLYVCQELSYPYHKLSSLKSLLIIVVSQLTKLPTPLFSAEFITRKDARSKATLRELYEAADRSAGRSNAERLSSGIFEEALKRLLAINR